MKMSSRAESLSENISELLRSLDKARSEDRASNAITKLVSMTENMLGELKSDRVTGKVKSRLAIEEERRGSGDRCVQDGR